MKNVEYKNMVCGQAKNGADYLEAPIGALEIGDAVVRTIEPTIRPSYRSRRGTPERIIETYVVTGFGGEFYSSILNCDVTRAYCEKTVECIALA